MVQEQSKRGGVLMVAYTHYETDPRVIREAEAAAQAGFDVDFLVLRRNGDLPVQQVNGVRVIRLNQYRYRGSGHLRYLLAYLEFFVRCFFKSTFLHIRRRYKVVHVNNMPDFLVFAAMLPKLFGAKVILDIHDPMPNTFASKFKTKDGSALFKLLLMQERLSAWFADAVLTVSDPVKEAILIPHGIPAGHIHVIANFADERLFALRDPSPVGERILMIFHGTILERYGLKDLMTAVSRMRHKNKILIRIIGEGDFSERLKGQIRELGLETVVDFQNRLYPLKDIPDIVSQANLGLVPLEISSITNYALPLKLIEYVSMGLPVVTVRSAAIAYYFEEADCMFYDPADLDSLVQILDGIAADPSELARRRERILELRNRFLWSVERAKYVALLLKLTGSAQDQPKAVYADRKIGEQEEVAFR